MDADIQVYARLSDTSLKLFRVAATVSLIITNDTLNIPYFLE